MIIFESKISIKVFFRLSSLNLFLIFISFTSYGQVSDTTLQRFCPFPFGASINASLLRTNTAYAALIAREYNSITPENAMKFGVIQYAQNGYSYSDADTIVAFAQHYGKRVHGHNLISSGDIPPWLLNFTGDSSAWENIMKNHIQTIVSYYKGKVSSWDVINEAIADDGTMGSSIWLQHLGSGYAARAFIYAHQADPNALLFYNDNSYEVNTNNFAKLRGISSFIKNMVANGVPINGVGMEMHVTKNTSNVDIETAIDTMLSTGLKIHISELDIAMNPENNQNLTYNSTIADQEFDKFKFFARIVKNIPVGRLYGITTWDVTDADSWIPVFFARPDFPLPFDNNYQKKLSYQGIKDGATESWTMSASTNGQNFLGVYSDLGLSGTAITTNFTGGTMSYDDDNSSVQNIGFNFVYNGSNYSQFVLNTNGYIKLGASPPSATNIFYPTITAFTGGVITTSDIDLIYPFNHDLIGGNLPEYRVYTSGVAGFRICTIQFKHLVDKLSPAQYSNLDFQIKLYEKTNSIDFVYGNWTASANTPTLITAAVGIKGINAKESVNVVKGSSTAWNTALGSTNAYYFQDGNYPATGPEFNTKNTFLPDNGRTFRFAAQSLLPVTIISFSGEKKGNDVLLQWVTGNNSNNKNFEIQKSTDAINFIVIRTLDAQLNINGVSNYNYTDIGATNVGVVYYRLKQNDKDGNSTYSNVIRINVQSNNRFKVTVVNPFNDTIDLQVTTTLQQIVDVFLISANGQQLLNKQLLVKSGTNACLLPLPISLPSGIYYLKIMSTTGQNTFKILKSK